MVVDPPEINATLTRDLGLTYPILADPTLAMIDAHGLRHPGGHDGHDIARSASVLIDGEGILRWSAVGDNFRVRPRPATILAAVNALPDAVPLPPRQP